MGRHLGRTCVLSSAVTVPDSGRPCCTFPRRDSLDANAANAEAELSANACQRTDPPTHTHTLLSPLCLLTHPTETRCAPGSPCAPGTERNRVWVRLRAGCAHLRCSRPPGPGPDTGACASHAVRRSLWPRIGSSSSPRRRPADSRGGWSSGAPGRAGPGHGRRPTSSHHLRTPCPRSAPGAPRPARRCRRTKAGESPEGLRLSRSRRRYIPEKARLIPGAPPCPTSDGKGACFPSSVI